MTKAQGRRSQRHKGKYADRFNITKANKARREKRRERIAKSDKTTQRKLVRMAKNVAKGIPRKNGGPNFTKPSN